jgi:hypothetical protein
VWILGFVANGLKAESTALRRKKAAVVARVTLRFRVA